jgi:hypothetical protein
MFDFKGVPSNRYGSRATGNVTSDAETNRRLNYQIQSRQKRQRRANLVR